VLRRGLGRCQRVPLVVRLLIVLVMQVSIRVVGEDVGSGSRVQISRCAWLYMVLHVLVLGRKGRFIGALGSLELVLVYVDMARRIEVHVFRGAWCGLPRSGGGWNASQRAGHESLVLRTVYGRSSSSSLLYIGVSASRRVSCVLGEVMKEFGDLDDQDNLCWCSRPQPCPRCGLWIGRDGRQNRMPGDATQARARYPVGHLASRWPPSII
jgi:hypothetical protein